MPIFGEWIPTEPPMPPAQPEGLESNSSASASGSPPYERYVSCERYCAKIYGLGKATERAADMASWPRERYIGTFTSLSSYAFFVRNSKVRERHMRLNIRRDVFLRNFFEIPRI